MKRKLLCPDGTPYGPLGGDGRVVRMRQNTFSLTTLKESLSGNVLLYTQSARGPQERGQSVLFEVGRDLGKLLRAGSL